MVLGVIAFQKIGHVLRDTGTARAVFSYPLPQLKQKVGRSTHS